MCIVSRTASRNACRRPPRTYSGLRERAVAIDSASAAHTREREAGARCWTAAWSALKSSSQIRARVGLVVAKTTGAHALFLAVLSIAKLLLGLLRHGVQLTPERAEAYDVVICACRRRRRRRLPLTQTAGLLASLLLFIRVFLALPLLASLVSVYAQRRAARQRRWRQWRL